MDERLMTSEEVAAFYRVDQRTIQRWAASGRLTAEDTPGRALRFRESVIKGSPAPAAELTAEATA